MRRERLQVQQQNDQSPTDSDTKDAKHEYAMMAATLHDKKFDKLPIIGEKGNVFASARASREKSQRDRIDDSYTRYWRDINVEVVQKNMGVPVPVPNNYASAIGTVVNNSVLGQKHNRRAAFNALFDQK